MHKWLVLVVMIFISFSHDKTYGMRAKLEGEDIWNTTPLPYRSPISDEENFREEVRQFVSDLTPEQLVFKEHDKNNYATQVITLFRLASNPCLRYGIAFHESAWQDFAKTNDIIDPNDPKHKMSKENFLRGKQLEEKRNYLFKILVDYSELYPFEVRSESEIMTFFGVAPYTVKELYEKVPQWAKHPTFYRIEGKKIFNLIQDAIVNCEIEQEGLNSFSQLQLR